VQWNASSLQKKIPSSCRQPHRQGSSGICIVEVVLQHAGGSSTAEGLARAQSALMRQVDAIAQNGSDPALHHGFLHNIPHHREIVLAWMQHNSANDLKLDLP
jgi:hypothetical protein